MKVLLIADNCSKKMGGEAILAYHYFRLLKKKKIFVKMIVHERNKSELEELFKEYREDLFFIEDTENQKKLWKIGSKIPQKVADTTFFFMIFLSTNFRMRKMAKKLVKEFDLDVVHQIMPVSPKVPSGIFKVGAPVIIGPMNGGMEMPEAFKKKITFSERVSYRIGKTLSKIMNLILPGKNQAELLLVANERTKNSLKNVLTFNRKIEIEIENGVDLDIWKNKIIIEDKSDNVEFIFIGRLIYIKGVNYLLIAFKDVLKKYSNAKLNIIGNGEAKEDWEKLAKDLGISDSVIFLGFVSQEKIPEILKRSRALLLPSICECGGAVVLEAMALEKAVIATNWGGPIDYIDSSCGILVAPESEEKFTKGLYEAMMELAENKELADTMGKNGRKKIEEYFDWDKKVDKMVEYYKMVKGEKRV